MTFDDIVLKRIYGPVDSFSLITILAQEIVNLKARVEFLENPPPDWIEKYDIELL